MKNKLIGGTVAAAGAAVIASFAFAVVASAAISVQSKVGVVSADSGAQIEVQTQAETQTRAHAQDSTSTGRGESAQAREKTQMQIQERAQYKAGTSTEATTSEASSTDNGKGGAMRSEVANAVHALLQIASSTGGVGQEIRTIAQNQEKNQETLQTNLQKIASRSGILSFLIGPDYGAIKAAQATLAQNEEQITALNQIKSKIANASDTQALAAQIQTLTQANAGIQANLSASQKGFSLFGWLVSAFVK